MQQSSNQQEKQQGDTAIKVAKMEVKDKWLFDMHDNIKDEEMKFIYTLCFQLLLQRQNLEVIQKSQNGDQRTQDLIKNNIKQIENLSLSKSFEDQQQSSYQVMKQVVDDHVVLEDEKYRIQKFRRTFLLRNAKQVEETIHILPTTQGKPPQILQMHDYIFVPQKNSSIQSEFKENPVLEKNVIEFNKSSALKWEEKASKYRLLLIPQNLKKNIGLNGDIDGAVAKANFEQIYMLYFKQFYKLQKIMNYALITSRQDTIDELTYTFNKSAKLLNWSIVRAFKQKLILYTQDLAIKKKAQQLDKILDLPTVVSQEDLNLTPINKQKIENSFDQVGKGSLDELKEEGSNKDKKSVELQKIPEEKETDSNLKPENQNQSDKRSESLSKKSSITLYKVETDTTIVVGKSQQDLENKSQKPEQKILTDNQTQQQSAQVAYYEIQNIQDEKQKYLEASIKNQQQPALAVNQGIQNIQDEKQKKNIEASIKNQQQFAQQLAIQAIQNTQDEKQKQNIEASLKNQPQSTQQLANQALQNIQHENQKQNLEAPIKKMEESGPITKEIFQQKKELEEQVIAINLINSDSNKFIQNGSQKLKENNIQSDLDSRKYIKVKDIINSEVQQQVLIYENREQINFAISQSQKSKVQQKLNLQEKRPSQEKIGLKSRQDSQIEFHSPIKNTNSSPQNFQSDNNFNKYFGQSDFLDYQSPLQMIDEESVYENIINEKEKRTLANPKYVKGFDSSFKPLNPSGQKKMIDMKSQVESYMQDPIVKQFIENENLYEHIRQSEKLPIQIKQINQNLDKQYFITKIMIHWYEEEPLDDFYNQVKDLVIGNNILPLQELTYKFSSKKEINKSDNVWQLNSRIQFSQDDIYNSSSNNNNLNKKMNNSGYMNNSESKINQAYSTQKLLDASWKIAIRNERGIDIVNGELKIGETILSCTEYGREQFTILKSPFASLSQSLFAILHLIIEIQAIEKEENHVVKVSQQGDKQENQQSDQILQIKANPSIFKNQQIYKTSFYQNISQIIRNQERFMYYLITNKQVIFPKRYVWIRFINDPEINKIMQFYNLLQADSEYTEVLNKCKNKLEGFNKRRIQKISEWQGKMQAELLMTKVRKNVFDILMQKFNKKEIHTFMVQKGIPNEYRFSIYSSIMDLHQILVDTKQLLEDLFQKSCTNVIEYLKSESKNYCNSLAVSASSLIYKKFPYHPAKSQAIFDIYQAYLMYDYITHDMTDQILLSPTINLLINIYENFLEEDQEILVSSYQISSKAPKFQSMKVSVSQNFNQAQQFKLACQQFDQQQFFAFTSLMNLLKEVDFNFIFFSLMNRISQTYVNLNFDNQIPALKDLIFEGCYSFFSNILVGELWNRIIDSVFIELIDIQKLEINFFLYCVSISILTIYIDYHIEESIQLNQEFNIGECFDELIQEFFSIYLNINRFFDVFYKTIKTDILIYQQITGQYSDYMTKIKLINGSNSFRSHYTYSNFNQFQFQDNFLQEQLDLELMKLKECEEYAEKQISDQRQVDLFIYLNDVPPQILQKSVLIITYEGIKQQKFIPDNGDSNNKKLQLSFKTKLPFLKTNSLYNEIEGREQIKFELIIQVSYQNIHFTGYLEWDPVNLFYNKSLVYLNQKSSLDIDKTILLSVYLEPSLQQSSNQSQIRNQQQNKYLDQNYVRNDVNTLGQCPIFMNEGISLTMHQFDYRSLQITNVFTTIDPLRFSANSSTQKIQNIPNKYLRQPPLKNFSKEAINDWFSKISFLIAHNSQLSIDERLQLLYLSLKSAFGFEVSIKNVLLLFKEIARIQGFILSFESLLVRTSQIIGKRLRNSIVVSIHFIDENGNKQLFIANNNQQNYLLDANVSMLEKEYEEVINSTFDEGIHLVDIRTIISQVHQNLLLKNSMSFISSTNIINSYYLQVMIDGCKNNYFIDQNGMIVITKSVQEQQILITKIPIFKNISVSQAMFIGIMQQSPSMLNYFCKYPKLQYFTKQIPLALQIFFFDLKNQQLFKIEPFQRYNLVDSIGFIIEDLLKKGNLPKQFSFSKYSCLTDYRQNLFLNDSLISQLNVPKLKELQENNLLITLNLYEGQEPQIKLPYSEVEKCKVLLNNDCEEYSKKFSNSDQNLLQFKAAIFTKEGISFKKLSKLSANNIYQISDTKNIISEQNVHII